MKPEAARYLFTIQMIATLVLAACAAPETQEPESLAATSSRA